MKPFTVFLLLTLLLPTHSFAQGIPRSQLSIQNEIRAGEALLTSFQKSQKWGETPEIAAIEKYLQEVGDKVAAHAKRKLPYKFHLDPHPGFRSAVAYPGGQIVVGGGVVALMTHEDQLAIVLGHEIGHVDLNQCRDRVMESMQKGHITANQFSKLSIEDFGSPYGKEGELAADREGMRLAVAAGYSPQASRISSFLSNGLPCSWTDAFGMGVRDAVTYLQLGLRFGEARSNATESVTKKMYDS